MDLKRIFCSERRMMRHHFLERESIFDSKAIGIIVKIDKHRLILLTPSSDFISPFIELIIRIIRGIKGLTSMKTKIDKI